MVKPFNREYKIKGRLLNIHINANIEYQIVPEHFDTNCNLYMRADKRVIGCTVLSIMIYRDYINQFIEPSRRLYEFIEKKFIRDTVYYG